MTSLPFYMEALTPEMKKRAKEELGETPDVKKETLRDLRMLISESPDFYCFEDDVFLLRFLRAKKYNVKRSFETLKNYYNFKKRYSGLMTESILSIIKSNYVFTHPYRLPDGFSMLTIFIGRIDLDHFTPDENLKAAMLVAEAGIEEDASQICGAHLLLDFKGITFKKLRQFSSPSYLAMIVRGLDNCWPYRVASFHVINEPFYFTFTYNIMWPMLSKKMKSRCFFHGNNLSSLHKYIPVEYLPQELGGPHGPDVVASQANITIAKHMELERVKKYSFLVQHKPVKKLSSCGLEESSIFCQTNLAMSKVVI